MQNLLDVIKQEALRKKISVWELLDELEHELENLNEEVKEHLTSEGIQEEVLQEMNDYEHFFIEKEKPKNIYQTNNLADLDEIDEEVYVYLLPINYYIPCEVLKENLVKITKEEAFSLAKQIIWNEEREVLIDGSYTKLANKILTKYA